MDTNLARYTKLKIVPYNPLIGATVHDVDLSDVQDESLRVDLRAALAEFQVLFFRQQRLTPEQQLDVARVFGDPDKTKAFFPRLEGHTAVEKIETTSAAHTGAYKKVADEWHTDITWSSNPPTGTILYARTIPAIGGDTLWASATRAYDLLSPALQTYLQTLEAVHSFEPSGWPDAFLAQENGAAFYAKARADNQPVLHPVVRTHPVTGRKILYVNPDFTTKIKGLSRRDSDALLTLLFTQFEKPDVQARLRWEQNTVAIWDNRATQHRAVPDFTGERVLHRVTFGEEQAF
jgi:taurine dioxygenase